MKHPALILTASLLLAACQSTGTVAEQQNTAFHPLTQGENSPEEFARHCAAEQGTLGVVQAADNRQPTRWPAAAPTERWPMATASDADNSGSLNPRQPTIPHKDTP